MPLDDILAWCAAIVGVGAAVTVLWKLARWMVAQAKKWVLFMDDWNGTPARPGVCATPGVMARLDTLDSGQGELTKRLDAQDVSLFNLNRHVGNGNPKPLREIVEANTEDIKDIFGIIGTRHKDAKRPAEPGPRSRAKRTVKA